MKRITIALLTTVVGAGLMSSAYAADLIINEPAPVGVVDVSGNWDGPYIGVFAGYGWGSAEQSTTDAIFDGDALDLSGWMLGVAAGANFTVGTGIVAGIVGDIAWSDISGYDADYFTSVDIDWTGSLRGKLGFDGGAFLPYLTAGLAVANATIDFDGDSDSNTHIGWTVGAGVEFAVADNVSIDLLYRYSDYGTQTYEVVPDSDVTLTAHTVSVGLNWRF
ncbi:outer membrane protein [Devosia sp. A16]|uniref:outer membrane protein n=1 Tax=Devosia sp. A16 TaxID=1736675 RepID=UPI0006D8552A|nr:outer membrane protein [Devosia sp. A16]